MVIGAHSDDEVLGCGATVSRLVRLGWRIDTILVTGERNGWHRAMDLLGFRSGLCLDLPHMQLNSVGEASLADHVLSGLRRIEREAATPTDLVLTHSIRDLNVDHRAVHMASLVACRPCNLQVTLWAYAIPGSSTWGAPSLGAFVPNVFVEISGEDLKAKTDAMTDAYAAEIRGPLHPRSVEGMETEARRLGQQAGVPLAEAFELVFDYRSFS